MAVKIEFYLSDEDIERLFAVKEEMGMGELTGNECAKKLLVMELRRLHTSKVKYDDETGERIK